MFFPHRASNSCGVLIAYLGKTSFVLHKRKKDHAGRIMILDITLDADQHILVDLCNADTETKQLKHLNKLQSLLNIFDINQNKRIMFAGDFNIFFNS